MFGVRQCTSLQQTTKLLPRTSNKRDTMPGAFSRDCEVFLDTQRTGQRACVSRLTCESDCGIDVAVSQSWKHTKYYILQHAQQRPTAHLSVCKQVSIVFRRRHAVAL